jgi:selenocysteine-specific elongation factor
VIAGASTIDLMILVIDITKGLQVQTAECIALGEILRLDLLVVLNKVDLLSEKIRWKKVQKSKIALQKMFKKSLFRNKEEVPVIGYSAKTMQTQTTTSNILNLALMQHIQKKKVASQIDEKVFMKHFLIEKIIQHSLKSYRFSKTSSKKKINFFSN